MNKDKFIQEVKLLGINLDDRMLEQLDIYKNFLQEYNEHTNLTRIISDRDIYLKHFYDSLTLSKAINLNVVDNLLDIGTGAGFPGMVLKIVYPNLNVTLLDSNNKKTKFLEELAQKLDVNVNIVNDRVEYYALNNLNKFDIVTSRAVANLRVLSELSLPLVKVDGLFIPLKGNLDAELEEAEETIDILSGKIIDKISFKLFKNDNERNILIVKKIKNTSKDILRPYDKIIKKPLKKMYK